MRRLATLALAALLVTSAAAAFATPAAAVDDAFVSVDVEATPDPAQPGTNVTVTATTENIYDDGSSFTVQEISLRETAERDSEEHDDYDETTIVGAGDELSVNLSEEFDETGEHERYVHVQLFSDSGEVVNLVRPVTVNVEQSHPSASLSADALSPSGNTEFSLTVANGLPDTVRGVTVDLRSDDVTLQEERRVVSSLDPGQQANLTVPARDVEPGQKTVTAEISYVTADGEARSLTETLSATVDDADRPGEIALSGVRTTQNGDELVVRGSASNVGATNASGVLVAVADGEDVGPAQNQANYFVGEVAASDYSSFEVHANLETDGNQTVSVPLDVAYDVDGERVTQTTVVEYTPNATDGGNAETQSSSVSILPLLGGGLLVIVVGGIAIRRFR